MLCSEATNRAAKAMAPGWLRCKRAHHPPSIHRLTECKVGHTSIHLVLVALAQEAISPREALMLAFDAQGCTQGKRKRSRWRRVRALRGGAQLLSISSTPSTWAKKPARNHQGPRLGFALYAHGYCPVPIRCHKRHPWEQAIACHTPACQSCSSAHTPLPLPVAVPSPHATGPELPAPGRLSS